MKKLTKFGLFTGVVIAILAGCGGPSQEEYDQLEAEYNSLSQLTDQVRKDFDELTEQYDQLQADYQALQEEKAALEQEYQSYQEFIYPYYEYIQGLQAQQSSEAQNQEAQLYQIAQTYETGLTYEDLVQEPDACMGQKFRIAGTVIDGNTSDGRLNLLIAADGDEDQLLLLSGSADWAEGISQGMNVNIYGTSGGLMDYMREDGVTIQIPGASLDYITQG